MIPEQWREIEGVPIYRVYQEGYGRGRPMTDWFSTSDSDRTVYHGQWRATEHEACTFAIDSLMGKGLVSFQGLDEYYQAGQAAIAEALKQGQLRLPIVSNPALTGEA